MITVSIFINGTPIFTRSARNITGTLSGLNEYRVDTGDIISHLREDGAIQLAHKMLDTIYDIDD